MSSINFEEENNFLEQMQNLNQQLENEERVENTLMEEAEAQPKQEEEQKKKTILDTLIEKDIVSREQVEAWKKSFGNKIFCTQFDEDDFVIYRYIARPEHKQLLKSLGKNITEELYNEMLFNKCVLYPAVDETLLATIPAGVIPTVATQIRIASRFIPDGIAMDMIFKL